MTRKRKGLMRLLALMAALAIVAGACGGNDNDDASSGGTSTTKPSGGETSEPEEEVSPSYGGKIVVGVETETNEWTPGKGSFAAPGTIIALSIYDPLVNLDANGLYKPFLAESLEANDELTEWTVTLREGVQFHDGTPLDAETLKWNFDTLHFAEGARNRGTLVNAGVTGMEIVDDLTVKYVLSEPNAGFPDLIRANIGYPISREAYEADPEGFGNRPVGTGPFEFVSWTRDDRLVVKRNENYWMTAANGDQLPYLDGIEFRVIPDDESRVAALAADDIQMIQSLRGPSIKRVLSMMDSGGFDGALSAGNQSSVTMINTLVPPLDDVRIRRALAYANDQDAMARVRDDDGLVPNAIGAFAEDSPWFSREAMVDYPGIDGANPERAAELVEEYKADPDRSDGKPVGAAVTATYECQPDPSLLQGAQLLQSLWGEIGIDLELIQVDQATMIAHVVGTADTDPPFKGNFMLACYRAGAGESDPLTYFRGAFGPVATTASNPSNLTDPRIDEALEVLATNTDFEVRFEAVSEINRVTSELVPYVWNVGTPTMVGYRDDIKGVTSWLLPDGSPGTGADYGYARFYNIFIQR
ncbi:MAG: ABC transporter substrate-binding protein [Acidimicrobiia bacterium]